MPVFKKKRGTTPASARRAAEEAKENWVSNFVNAPNFHIDLGIWARLTRTMIRRGRYLENVDPAAGERLYFESHPFDMPVASVDALPSKSKSGE